MTPSRFDLGSLAPGLPAAERGLTSGRFVKLRSAYGEVRVQVLISDRVEGKQLYMALNTVDNPVNRLTSSYTDRSTHTPAFKETAVSMTVLPEQGDNPLPRKNFVSRARVSGQLSSSRQRPP